MQEERFVSANVRVETRLNYSLYNTRALFYSNLSSTVTWRVTLGRREMMTDIHTRGLATSDPSRMRYIMCLELSCCNYDVMLRLFVVKDMSVYVRKVQFKLHESYPSPIRSELKKFDVVSYLFEIVC